MLKALSIPRIRKAILFTVLILYVYLIGRALTVPGVNVKSLYAGVSSTPVFTLMNLISGGGLERLSLFSLGVSPIVSASIVIELLSMDVIPTLTEWKKEGTKGQEKLNRVTQYLGVLLAALQAFALVYSFDKQYGVLVDSSPIGYARVCIILTAGTLLLGWLGSKISEYGVGNGTSVIILFGILSGLPSMFTNLYNEIFGRITTTQTQNILLLLAFVLIYILTIFLVIFIDLAIRKIKLQYSRKLTTGGNLHDFPLKVNLVSVIPVIYASSFMSAPLLILSWFNYSKYQEISTKYGMGTPVGLVIFASLIVLFSFFQAHSTFNSEKFSEDLSKTNAYIPGIRPGKSTTKYMNKVLNYNTVIPALMLLGLSLLPYLLTSVSGISSSSALGGTSVLLISGILLDIIDSIRANIKSGKYKEWGVK